MDTKISFDTVKDSATATVYCLAYTCDLQLRQGAGAAMLALPSDCEMPDWPSYSDFDLGSLDATKGLETVFRYAVHGELEGAGINDDCEEGNLGRLQALLSLVSNDVIDRNWDDISDMHGPHDCGRALAAIVALAAARFNLDHTRFVSLEDIALLGDMQERSVRNALHAEGESLLVATRDDKGELVVEKSEALRWLQTRRGFKQTVQIGTLGPSTPSALQPDEIMPFLRARLADVAPQEHLRELLGYTDAQIAQAQYENTASKHGLPVSRVEALFRGPLQNLSPDEDCPLLSQILMLDNAWLSAQVLRAKFPQTMREVAPVPPASSSVAISPFNEREATLDVKLTDAGIRNGYFDIEARYAERLFPADSFGSRGGDRHGVAVELHHDIKKKSPYVTDMRVKSESLVSPRKRFSAYFTAHAAKAGDVIRIRRTGERAYTLSFISRPEA